jgi:dihydropteroate synthase
LISEFNPAVTALRGQAEAESRLKTTGCTEMGLKIMAKKARHFCIQLENVPSPAALILKQEMLSISGEAAIPSRALINDKKKGKVILMGTLAQFERLSEKLKPQPFSLNKLGEELMLVLGNLERKSFKLALPNGALELGEKPVIMGILNITPDSFFDGGKYQDPGQALARAEQMAEQGAEIIDIGGESTRPGSDPVPLEEEIKRVIPVLKKISARLPKTIISIDTQKAEVARQAMDSGASIINDISALGADTQMAKTAAETKAALVLMHIRGTPKDMQQDPVYEDLFGEIINFLKERMEQAVAAGVDPEKIIVDPGIGFGKTVEHNLELIRDLWRLRTLVRPVLLGTSSKSFIGKVLAAEKDDRFEGSAASAVAGILSGADIIRVHEPGKMKRFVGMAAAIRAGRPV